MQIVFGLFLLLAMFRLGRLALHTDFTVHCPPSTKTHMPSLLAPPSGRKPETQQSLGGDAHINLFMTKEPHGIFPLAKVTLPHMKAPAHSFHQLKDISELYEYVKQLEIGKNYQINRLTIKMCKGFVRLHSDDVIYRVAGHMPIKKLKIARYRCKCPACQMPQRPELLSIVFQGAWLGIQAIELVHIPHSSIHLVFAKQSLAPVSITIHKNLQLVSVSVLFSVSPNPETMYTIKAVTVFNNPILLDLRINKFFSSADKLANVCTRAIVRMLNIQDCERLAMVLFSGFALLELLNLFCSPRTLHAVIWGSKRSPKDVLKLTQLSLHNYLNEFCWMSMLLDIYLEGAEAATLGCLEEVTTMHLFDFGFRQMHRWEVCQIFPSLETLGVVFTDPHHETLQAIQKDQANLLDEFLETPHLHQIGHLQLTNLPWYFLRKVYHFQNVREVTITSVTSPPLSMELFMQCYSKMRLPALEALAIPFSALLAMASFACSGTMIPSTTLVVTDICPGVTYKNTMRCINVFLRGCTPPSLGLTLEYAATESRTDSEVRSMLTHVYKCYASYCSSFRDLISQELWVKTLVFKNFPNRQAAKIEISDLASLDVTFVYTWYDVPLLGFEALLKSCERLPEDETRRLSIMAQPLGTQKTPGHATRTFGTLNVLPLLVERMSPNISLSFTNVVVVGQLHTIHAQACAKICLADVEVNSVKALSSYTHALFTAHSVYINRASGHPVVKKATWFSHRHQAIFELLLLKRHHRDCELAQDHTQWYVLHLKRLLGSGPGS
ncbi:hypothetical protein NEDG_01785 [Nematocida displodere]|uniref:Uncharacterized protein n=1 Tax=Nematocida displodere TaxID=1805483 RepID=A0A177EH85_9MICR|nr:hypothetical protein NEDG_01785 [Nematocida displodere]